MLIKQNVYAVSAVWGHTEHTPSDPRSRTSAMTLQLYTNTCSCVPVRDGRCSMHARTQSKLDVDTGAPCGCVCGRLHTRAHETCRLPCHASVRYYMSDFCVLGPKKSGRKFRVPCACRAAINMKVYVHSPSEAARPIGDRARRLAPPCTVLSCPRCISPRSTMQCLRSILASSHPRILLHVCASWPQADEPASSVRPFSCGLTNRPSSCALLAGQSTAHAFQAQSGSPG